MGTARLRIILTTLPRFLRGFLLFPLFPPFSTARNHSSFSISFAKKLDFSHPSVKYSH